MSHKASNMIATCMDLRIQKIMHDWISDHALYGKHDRVSFAGAGGNLPVLLSQVDLSIKLHHTSEINIFNHQGCGYYGDTFVSGSEEELEKHTKDLKEAKRVINEKYPNVAVKGYFIKLNDEETEGSEIIEIEL